MPVDFYRPCRLIGARTTVFADECQRITDTQSTQAEIGTILAGSNRHDLTVRHRTTRQVAALAARLHVGGHPPALPDRQGPVPELHRYGSAHQVAERIAEYAGAHPAHRVGVVLRHTRQQMDLVAHMEHRLTPACLQAYVGQSTGRYRALHLDRPGATVLNRASAKGLGFDVVFVPDTHLDAGEDPAAAGPRMRYYVLITRAGSRLFLGYAGESEPPLPSAVLQAELARGAPHRR
ncbi:hypothetical protein ACFXB4_11335 [Streptomyces lavendulae]|uniref:hypothetical protein n=1 Tax=Streptomyces lavendulae TaxID=1914 RepID=UPI0036AEE8AB